MLIVDFNQYVRQSARFNNDNNNYNYKNNIHLNDSNNMGDDTSTQDQTFQDSIYRSYSALSSVGDNGDL